MIFLLAIVSALAGETTSTFAGGSSYNVRARPSLVSIYSSLNDVEVDTVHVIELQQSSAYKRCGGTSTARVIVMNHGIPVPVWAPQGVPSGFIEVYADLDLDGKPDATAYKVLNPSVQNGFYATWRVYDNLKVIYLRESGSVLEIPGFPLQTLWRKPTTRDNTRTGVIACNMDPLSYIGGHRQETAYSMSQVW